LFWVWGTLLVLKKVRRGNSSAATVIDSGQEEVPVVHQLAIRKDQSSGCSVPARTDGPSVIVDCLNAVLPRFAGDFTRHSLRQKVRLDNIAAFAVPDQAALAGMIGPVN